MTMSGHYMIKKLKNQGFMIKSIEYPERQKYIFKCVIIKILTALIELTVGKYWGWGCPI